MRDLLSPGGPVPRPADVTFTPGSIIRYGYEQLILYVRDFDPDNAGHDAFRTMLRTDVDMRIDYESRYGPVRTWYSRGQPPRAVVWRGAVRGVGP